MTIDDLIAGLQTLRPYYDEDGPHVGAERDVIYTYDTDRSASDEDRKKLLALGWERGEADTWKAHV